MTSSARTLRIGTALLLGGPVLVLTISCGGKAESPAQPAALPSRAHPVVLVAVDGLRADHVGSAGAALGVATPNLDALAVESIRFDQAFAQATSFSPSLASILSGLYPTTNGLVDPGDRLQGAAETLAESFTAGGLMTAAFVEGEPGGDDYGLGQGFARYEQGLEPGKRALEWMGGIRDEDFLVLVAGWSVGDLSQVVADLEPPAGFADRFRGVLVERGEGRPALLDQQDLEFARRLYANRVRALDARVGEFVAAFRNLGLDRRATLVLVATNGLAMQEHRDLFGDSVYPQVTRVPMLVRLPGGQRSASVAKVVETVDLMPTILDLCGLPTPKGVQGESLVPLIEGQGKPPYIAFGESGKAVGQRFAALDGYQLVVGGHTTELFNLAADPLGLVDVSGSDPHRVEVLQHHLEAWGKLVAATSLDPARRSGTLDDATLDQLKSLGYVQ